MRRLKSMAFFASLSVAFGVNSALATEFVVNFEKDEGYSVNGGDVFGSGNLVGQPSGRDHLWLGSGGWNSSGRDMIRVVDEDGQMARTSIPDTQGILPIYYLEVPAEVVEGGKITFSFRFRYEDQPDRASRDAIFRIGLEGSLRGDEPIVKFEFLSNGCANYTQGNGTSKRAFAEKEEWVAKPGEWVDVVMVLNRDAGTYTVKIGGFQQQGEGGSEFQLAGQSFSPCYISLRALRDADRMPPIVSVDELKVAAL